MANLDHALEFIPLGIYEKALPQTMTWLERLSVARRLGYDFVEPTIDENEARIARLDWGPQERRALRDSAQQAGMPLRSLVLSAHRRYPLGSLSSETRRTGLDLLYKAIDFAADTGLRYILIAGIDVYYEESSGATRALFLKGLEQGFLRASSAGVMLALENWDIRIDTLRDAMGYVNYFDSPWFQLYVDIGNLVYAGHDVLSELELARGHIAALHIKDTLPGKLRFVPLGEGAVPFVDAFAKLADFGFQGPACLELWTEKYPDSIEIVAAARPWLRRQMELGWGCFVQNAARQGETVPSTDSPTLEEEKRSNEPG